ncbi:MAG: VWA domain-containing protein [Deltaproteobacteria bacterium]|nr:VWA domain-containing protein [Deltaproteobacteria bacterium]
MTYRKPVVGLLVATALTSALLGACTDAGLYQWKRDPYQANKLTVSGTVCSDDPRQRNFPVKILFMIDTSQSLASDANDPSGFRGKAVDDITTTWGKNPNYSFGIIAFGAKARNLIDEGFTRDSSKLSSAAASVQSSGGAGTAAGCIAGRCRDLRAAMSLANSIITGDILSGNPGLVARTTYVLVLFSGGSPVPAMSRCACRDKQTETLVDNWQGCPWTECDGCKVTCPASTTCKDTQCFPVCNPECDDRQFCDTDFVCKDKDDSFSGNPTVPPVSGQPVGIPDTFTQWYLPAKHGLDASKLGGAKSCQLACVYPAGGHPDSCEERQLIATVRELRDFAKKNGAAQLQLHTTYLPDKEQRQAPDPFLPPCNDPAADEARTVRLLSEMAFAGDGGFTQFGQASAITFKDVDLHTSRDALVIKELVVTNANVMTDAQGIHADSDQDGLPDEVEQKIGLCQSDRDTDGDGLGDAVEVKLSTDPLVPNDPVECVDLIATQTPGEDLCKPGTSKSWKTYEDKDKDSLNACEERLLGTEDSLFDSDADGIPDKVEFVAGTNYLEVDPLRDADFDGVVNREEVRGHTDPRSNDAQGQLDLAYRYEEVDEGVKTVHSYSQPPTITGVMLKNVSAQSAPGVGYLRFNPGPPPTLSWRSPADMGPGGDFGPPVDISKNNNEGYQLVSKPNKEHFVTVLVEGPASYPPKELIDKIVISAAPRNCLRFRVRNITLLDTAKDPELKTTGNNTVFIFFAEAPKNAKDGFGIFRVASVRLNYTKGPPESRTPKAAELSFADDDFVLFE